MSLKSHMGCDRLSHTPIDFQSKLSLKKVSQNTVSYHLRFRLVSDTDINVCDGKSLGLSLLH